MMNNHDTIRLKEEAFFAKIQKYLNLFVFFLLMGFVKIANISVTFFIFLMIVYTFMKKNKKLFRVKSTADYIVVIFFAILITSIFLSEETYRHLGIDSDIKTIVRLLYWMSLTLFIKTWAHRFDFYQVSKYIFFGLVSTIIFYYTLNMSLRLITQNSFAYTLVLGVPFSMFYIYRRYSFVIVFIVTLLFFYFALASTSRAGALIVFGELVLMLIAAKYMSKKTLFFLSIISILIVFGIYPHISSYRNDLASLIEPYSPDLSSLIGRGDNSLKIDKSWLDRKQMIVKGTLIFQEHPFLGIGFSHFKYYWVDMQLISPVLNKSMIFYNRLSCHNTYIQVLAGAGIFALSLLVIMEFLVLKRGIKILLQFKFKPEIFVFISFLGMIIYFYVIAAGMGAITWFVFGYGLSLLNKKYEVK